VRDKPYCCAESAGQDPHFSYPWHRYNWSLAEFELGTRAANWQDHPVPHRMAWKRTKSARRDVIRCHCGWESHEGAFPADGPPSKPLRDAYVAHISNGVQGEMG